MTGQGNKDFERIKRTKQTADVIDLGKRYRTADGHAVRGLHVVSTNKTVIGGRVIVSAHYHNIIGGQVYVQNQWMAAEWKANGTHPQEQYSLVEQQAETSQVSLF